MCVCVCVCVCVGERVAAIKRYLVNFLKIVKKDRIEFILVSFQRVFW